MHETCLIINLPRCVDRTFGGDGAFREIWHFWKLGLGGIFVESMEEICLSPYKSDKVNSVWEEVPAGWGYIYSRHIQVLDGVDLVQH